MCVWYRFCFVHSVHLFGGPFRNHLPIFLGCASVCGVFVQIIFLRFMYSILCKMENARVNYTCFFRNPTVQVLKFDCVRQMGRGLSFSLNPSTFPPPLPLSLFPHVRISAASIFSENFIIKLKGQIAK